MKKLVLCFLVFYVGSSSAQIVTSARTTIDMIYAYDDFGAISGKEGADISIWLKTGVAECPRGVWLTPNAPAYKTLSSYVLAAYMSKIEVEFQVYTDRIWGGSGNPLCQVDAIRLK